MKSHLFIVLLWVINASDGSTQRVLEHISWIIQQFLEENLCLISSMVNLKMLSEP